MYTDTQLLQRVTYQLIMLRMESTKHHYYSCNAYTGAKHRGPYFITGRKHGLFLLLVGTSEVPPSLSQMQDGGN